MAAGGAPMGAGGRIDLSFGGQTVQGGQSAGGAQNAAGGRMVTKDCAAVSVTATDVMSVQPADIIFAIDSSRSMDEEIAFVRSNMNAFSQQIVNSGVDVRVIMLGATQAICIDGPLGSGQCPDDTHPPAYVHVPQAVGSRDALNIIINSFQNWRDQLRPGASKSFVVVTDDNATDRPNNSAATFTQNLRNLDQTLFEKFSFNGVYCFTQCEQAAAIGTVYKELVESTQGVSGDLCLQDFQPVFNRLAEKIITTSASQIACEWGLPSVPNNGQTFSPNLVEVRRNDMSGNNVLTRAHTKDQCDANGGWYFDNNLNPTKILACPSTCSAIQNQKGGKIEVSFGCEQVGACVATNSSSLGTGNGCEWNMPPAPPGQVLDRENVNVRYTSSAGFATDLGRVPNGGECANFEDGWYYDDPQNPKKITACPQTCTQIKAGGDSSKVDILFGCKTEPVPVVK